MSTEIRDKAVMLEALFAFDTGCVDSGIHDDIIKSSIFKEIRKSEEIPEFVNEIPRFFLSKEGIEQGYSLEDVRMFLDWLSDNGCDI